MKKPHPKDLRPDITYPSPDPAREPLTVTYKVGDEIIVKPYIHVDGYDLTGSIGTVMETSSYLLVAISVLNPATVKIETEVFKLLRYEVEPLDNWDPFKSITT